MCFEIVVAVCADVDETDVVVVAAAVAVADDVTDVDVGLFVVIAFV